MAQPTHDDKRARFLDALDNDLLIRCASYLDADGLVQLGRTSSSFGRIPQAGEGRSLVNEAAHQRFRPRLTRKGAACQIDTRTNPMWACVEPWSS